MKILSISCSHEKCINYVDGTIVASAAEERFTKIKGEAGYPKMQLNFV